MSIQTFPAPPPPPLTAFGPPPGTTIIFQGYARRPTLTNILAPTPITVGLAPNFNGPGQDSYVWNYGPGGLAVGNIGVQGFAGQADFLGPNGLYTQLTAPGTQFSFAAPAPQPSFYPGSPTLVIPSVYQPAPPPQPGPLPTVLLPGRGQPYPAPLGPPYPAPQPGPGPVLVIPPPGPFPAPQPGPQPGFPPPPSPFPGPQPGPAPFPGPPPFTGPGPQPGPAPFPGPGPGPGPGPIITQPQPTPGQIIITPNQITIQPWVSDWVRFKVEDPPGQPNVLVDTQANPGLAVNPDICPHCGGEKHDDEPTAAELAAVNFTHVPGLPDT